MGNIYWYVGNLGFAQKQFLYAHTPATRINKDWIGCVCRKRMQLGGRGADSVGAERGGDQPGRRLTRGGLLEGDLVPATDPKLKKSGIRIRVQPVSDPPHCSGHRADTWQCGG